MVLSFFPLNWLPATNPSETTQNSTPIPEIVITKPHTRPFQEVYVSPQELKDFLRVESAKYGLDYKTMYSVVLAESGFNLNAYNEIGKSYGVGQFIKSTFLANCKGDYINPLHQITCMCQMFARGEYAQWDAWCLMYGKENISCKKRGF